MPELEAGYSLRFCFNPRCNAIYPARNNSSGDYCPECANRINAENRAQRQANRRLELEGGLRRRPMWEIEHDPTPTSEGGFEKGARFDGLEISLMLEEGALVMGTKLRFEDKTFTVRKNTLIDEQGKTYLIIRKSLVAKRQKERET